MWVNGIPGLGNRKLAHKRQQGTGVTKVRRLRVTITALFVLAWSSATAADLRIASWNIQNLGWGDDTHYGAIAAVANHFDLVAVQEVMEPAAVERLAQRLEREGGDRWGVLTSSAVGSSHYEEHYAFLYRESAVAYTGKSSLYRDPGDVFIREPASAQFRSKRTGRTLTVGSIHVLYGDGVADRLPEIERLGRYWQSLADRYERDAQNGRILLLGDFNLWPDHAGFEALDAYADALISEGATTLSSDDGRYANLYDNIWVPDESGFEVSDSGILRFPELLDWDHETARARASDHAPVYLTLGNAELDLADARVTADTCIDLNAAHASALDQLPHVGPARAEAIVEGRPWNGPNSLTRIRGIGEARAADIAAAPVLCD